MRRGDSTRIVRGLGALAGALGVMAALAGSPYAAQHGHIDVDALARAVTHEDDHITAIELAEWIRDRRSDVRLIDIRSLDEYESFHIPTAERIPIESLSVRPFRAGETIVLYSDGGAHAAQAWVFLRALGHDKVFFLRGGLYEWLDQVMSPALQANAPAKDSAAFVPVATLSRYFGGIPRFGAPAESASTKSLVLKVRRRGC